MSTSDKTRGFRPGTLILPGILILIGVLFLLANFDLLEPGWWFNLFRLWPLLLVLAGIAIIAGRVTGGWAVLLVTVVVVILVLAGLYAALASSLPDGAIRGEAITESWDAPLGTTEEAEVILRLGAGTLDLGALPAESASLVEASFSSGGGRSTPRRSVERRNSRAVISVTSSTNDRIFFPFENAVEEWDIRLNPGVSLTVRLQGGASRSRMDLSALRVQDLEVDVGASEASIRFPEGAGTTQARIRGGAARLTLEIPPGVAARIDTRLGASSTNIDASRFPKVGDVYISPDYDTATNKVDLRIDSGASSITVR